MRSVKNTIIGLSVAAALVLTGCGGDRTPTREEYEAIRKERANAASATEAPVAVAVETETPQESIFATVTSEEPQVQVPVSAEPQISIDTCISVLDDTLKTNFGENHTIYRDGRFIYANIWREGIIVGAFAAKGGDAEALEAWGAMKESMLTMQTSIQETINNYGHEDYIVVLNVMNDLNLENSILTVAQGVVLADFVEGTNYFGDE